MISTLAIGLSLALILGLLAYRLKLSPLVGYLMAGIIVGSPMLHLDVDAKLIEGFSHLGVILLLFGVGLQFHLKDLLAVYKTVVPGALLCIVINSLLGALAYHYLAPNSVHELSAIMYGLCICVSSTVVLTRVLDDNKILHSPSGHTAIGWLVVEDIFTILLLVLLPLLIRSGADASAEGGFDILSIITTLGLVILKISLLVVVVALLGRYLLPKVLSHVSKSSSSDLFTLSVLVLALGIAVVSAYVFNASMEFGAFLSGMIVGQSKFSARAASEALPLRDAFAVLFFLSVGMGFQIDALLQDWQLALATAAICILIKPLLSFTFLHLIGKTSRLSLSVSGSLSQIGEFSFILASLAAKSYGLLPQAAVDTITGVAILSITINSIGYRFIPKLIKLMEHKGIGLLREKHPKSLPELIEDTPRLIVVGYGPCGQLITRILHSYEMEVIVLEMNIDTVNKLATEHIPALLGDARLRPVLITAGIEQAKALIITAPSAPSQEISAMARSINPKIQVMAHTHYLSSAQLLRKNGADTVYSGEEEVAISMTSNLLRAFGATEDQIQLERRYVRKILNKLSQQQLAKKTI